MSTPVPREARTPARNAAAVLLVASGATFVAFLDATVVNVAFPNIRSDFARTALSNLSWVVSIYAVLLAALLTPAGRLADVIGRRRMFLSGLVSFTAASALSALAPNLALLVAARGLQGAGAAAMIPAALGLVLAAAEPAKRAMAVGLWAAAASLAAAAGPSIGGVLVNAWGWRAVFVINVPIGVFVAVAALCTLPRDRRQAQRLPDALGTVLLAVGIGLLVTGLTKAKDWGWASSSTIVALAAGAVLLIIALRRASRHAAPAIEVDLWRHRSFRVANLTSLVFGAAVFAWLLVGTLFLTSVWHYSLLDTGLAVSPGALSSAVAAVVVGRRATLRGQRVAVSAGALLMVATMLWSYLALGRQHDFLAFWLPAGLVGGVAVGVTLTALATVAVGALPPLRFAGGTGMNMTARQVGGALGVAATGLILSGSAVPRLSDFREVFLFCGLTASAAAISGLGLLGRSYQTGLAAASVPAATPSTSAAGVNR